MVLLDFSKREEEEGEVGGSRRWPSTLHHPPPAEPPWPVRGGCGGCRHAPVPMPLPQRFLWTAVPPVTLRGVWTPCSGEVATAASWVSVKGPALTMPT